VAVRLKWHKLRYRATDPPYQRHNLVAALAAGQPCEVDLRFTADHHALCIHERDLQHETTGTGPVARAGRAEVEALRQRGNDGEVLDGSPLFLDEVVAAVRQHGDVGPGLVQLDVKTPLAALHPEALGHFGRTLGDAAPAFIASGYDWNLIRHLTEAAPGLQAGFDPLALYRHPTTMTARAFRGLSRHILAQCSGAAIYYLEAGLVLAGLDRGVDLVSAVTAGGTNGALVDAWTVDPGRPQLDSALRRLLEVGVGQITTNDPAALSALLPR
jgi:glycerophosphoryl diester phosphodiesterase